MKCCCADRCIRQLLLALLISPEITSCSWQQTLCKFRHFHKRSRWRACSPLFWGGLLCWATFGLQRLFFGRRLGIIQHYIPSGSPCVHLQLLCYKIGIFGFCRRGMYDEVRQLQRSSLQNWSTISWTKVGDWS